MGDRYHVIWATVTNRLIACELINQSLQSTSINHNIYAKLWYSYFTYCNRNIISRVHTQNYRVYMMSYKTDGKRCLVSINPRDVETVSFSVTHRTYNIYYIAVNAPDKL